MEIFLLDDKRFFRYFPCASGIQWEMGLQTEATGFAAP
jgi:hypothetical protein